jgi:hypothetical protein
MATDLSIINAALTRVGEDPITSLSGGGVAEQIASQNYETLVEAHLSVHPWKRSSKIAQLNRIDADVHGEPPEPWTAAYQLPAEFAEIRTVKIGGDRIDYEVHGDKILCDADEADEVILHYVWRASEGDWPAWFREGIIRELEAIFLRGIGERYREAEARQAEAREWWKTAKNRDAQQQTPRDPLRSTTLAARRG